MKKLNKEKMKYRRPGLHKLFLVVYIDNEDLSMSLKIGKVYLAWPEHKLLRVIDETEEDYLYEWNNFIEISTSGNKQLMEILITKLERSNK